MEPVLKDFRKMISRLHEVLKMRKTTVTRDSAVKRFELCFDLAWKAVQIYVRREGMECHSPRAAFKCAFQLNLIDHDKVWLEMIENRNKSVHLYEESSADLIYAKLPRYLELLKGLYAKLSSEKA